MNESLEFFRRQLHQRGELDLRSKRERRSHQVRALLSHQSPGGSFLARTEHVHRLQLHTAWYPHGNTSDSLVLPRPPFCLRLLDPVLDSNNRFIPDDSLMRQASALSNPQRILRDRRVHARVLWRRTSARMVLLLPKKRYSSRVVCDWDEANRLADAVRWMSISTILLSCSSSGYAHAGNWDDVRLSKEARHIEDMLIRCCAVETYPSRDNLKGAGAKRSVIRNTKNLIECPDE